MNEQKSLIHHFVEAYERYHAEQRTAAPAQRERLQHPNRLRRFLRWLTPNGGTLLLIVALIATAQVWAKPLTSPTNAPGPSATTVNYQGRLADSGGTPLDGPYGMSFSLWDADTDGSLVWGPEGHAAVPVSEGLFSVGLGSQTSGGIPTNVWNGDRYLEITVGSETLSPRELIRSVPIAGMALTVPDGAISSRNMAPTMFSIYSSGEVSVSSDSTEVLSLAVDFPVDATYLIFVRVSSRPDQDGRIISSLKDENGNDIAGSGLHTYHCASCTHTGSTSTVYSFSAGAHTIRLFAFATGGSGASGAVRSAHIIAIPFAQAP